MNIIKQFKVYIISYIIAIILLIFLAIAIYNSQATEINKVIKEKGGTIESVDRRLIHAGPFNWFSSNQTKYKIVYRDKDGENQEAWVKFGFIVWSDKWVWDYKEK